MRRDKCWVVAAVMCLLLLPVLNIAPAAQDEVAKQEQACKDNLRALADGLKLYLIYNDGKVPVRLSELYKGGFVADPEVFSCPASGKRPVDEAQIDQLTDYEMATPSPGEKRLPILKEKYGFHAGQALVLYADGSFGKTAAPAPPAVAKAQEPPGPSTPPPSTPPAVSGGPPPTSTTEPSVSLPPSGPTAVTGPLTQPLPPTGPEPLTPPQPPGTAQEYYQKALQTRNLEEKMANLNKAIDLDPKDHRFFTARAQIYHNQRNFSKALEDYNRAIELNPSYDLPYYWRGEIYRTRNELDRALQDFHKAVGLNPKESDYYLNLANVYFMKKNFDLALRNYQQAVALNPKNDKGFYGLGITYFQKRDPQKALTNFNQALALNPNNADALKYRNYVQVELNKRSVPTPPQVGQVSRQIGPEAIFRPKPELFRKLSQREPNNIAVMQKLGASPQAVAFAQSTEDKLFISKLTKYGPVDLAICETDNYFVFANPHGDYFYLINGNPPTIAINDIRYLKPLNLVNNNPWSRSNPPGMMSFKYTRFMKQVKRPNGGQRFIFGFPIYRGSHAGGIYGYVPVAYDFERSGQFLGTKVLSASEAGK